MSRGRAATRKDVAQRAGVAPSTVSLVLNKTPGTRIPPETRKRVEDAARELGYQSSAIARALVSGRTSTIGVVVHFLKQPFHSYSAAVLDGAWDELASQGYRMLIVNGTPEWCVGGLFRERSVDGLLVLAPPLSADDAELRDLVRSRFPTVFIGAVPQCCADRMSYADTDNVAAGYRAAEILLKAGHRRILHLAGNFETSSVASDRLAGVRMAMREHGLTLADDQVIDCSWNFFFAEERLGAALDRGLAPTAIVAANHSMAHGAVRALLRRGRRVPEDISITAVDSAEPDPVSNIRITCLEQQLSEIGRNAGRNLLEQIRDPKSEPRRMLLPFREIAGNSVKAPA